MTKILKFNELNLDFLNVLHNFSFIKSGNSQNGLASYMRNDKAINK